MEPSVEWRDFTAVAITTHPIPAYGGFQAPLQLLERMARQFNEGTVPMHAHHDLTNPIRTRGVTAVVKQREDGYHELALTGEVHADDWGRVAHLSGMSVTLIGRLEEDGIDSSDSEITLAADAGWFDDESIIEAAEILASAVPTAPARAYQFGLIADPQIYVELSMAALQLLGPNLAASALWDGLKLLFARRRIPQSADPASPTIINFSVTDRGGWTAAIETSDPEVACKAIESLSQAVTKATEAQPDSGGAAPIRWDPVRGGWFPVD